MCINPKRHDRVARVQLLCVGSVKITTTFIQRRLGVLLGIFYSKKDFQTDFCLTHGLTFKL
jgi:hypothetical protein